ncbi:MAG: transposase [Candidatus Moeniiplasma glomeromycotorum]|nr:transposase [Candidatus Moeniiplasma glomeromycotorum]MCE8169340.1 transposase [Candidatus Moeniiplasma glomeromycotorum]
MKHLKERQSLVGNQNILTKTYQGKLKPISETKRQLQLISKGCNEVYNYFLKKRIKADKKNQPQPTSEEQQKDLVKLKKTKKYQWLNKIPAWTLQEVVKNRLPDAWKKYKEYKAINTKAKYPREKSSNRWYDSFSIHQEGYQIKDNQLILSQGNYKGKRQSKIIIPFELTNSLKGKPTIITISWKKDQWKINLTCDIKVPPQIPKTEIKRMNGVDRNVRKLFANSDGWKFTNPYYWEKVEKEYIEFQKSLSRKVKGSNNWKKVKDKMKRLCQKTSNQMKDVCHKTSRKLVNKNDLLAYEKLNTAEMVKKIDKKGKKRKIWKWTADGMMKACWTQQVQFATYKVKETGKWIEFVNPHNTSKRCSKCGKINEKLRDEEIFVCPHCDNVLDRDVNAAKNILWKAQIKLGLTPTG